MPSNGRWVCRCGCWRKHVGWEGSGGGHEWRQSLTHEGLDESGKLGHTTNIFRIHVLSHALKHKIHIACLTYLATSRYIFVWDHICLSKDVLSRKTRISQDIGALRFKSASWRVVTNDTLKKITFGYLIYSSIFSVLLVPWMNFDCTATFSKCRVNSHEMESRRFEMLFLEVRGKTLSKNWSLAQAK